MNPNTFNVHFVIRNNRVDKDGLAPIYAKIIINGQLLQISLNHKIKPKEWDSKQEVAKQACKTRLIINEAVESFRSRIYQAYSKIIAGNDDLTTENIKAAFYGTEKETTRVYYLVETAQEHNKHFESMVGIKYSSGSYKNYKTTLKYLIEFVPQFYKHKDIPLEKADFKFCEAFFTYLTTLKNCKVNGANKQIQRLKKIVNYGLMHGYLVTNPMASYALQFTPVNKVALTLDEIGAIQRLELQRETLSKVKDVFIVQCYTGLAYADIKRLSINDIVKDANGGYWIKMERQKTKVAFAIPLLQPAMAVLGKYILAVRDNQPLMQVLSNQKMNDNLKLIQELAKIEKPLTTHLARHTFATTITLGNGVPIETVSRMLGHTKLSTTQVYAKVLDNKISDDMDALKTKLNKLNKEL